MNCYFRPPNNLPSSPQGQKSPTNPYIREAPTTHPFLDPEADGPNEGFSRLNDDLDRSYDNISGKEMKKPCVGTSQSEEKNEFRDQVDSVLIDELVSN